MGPSLAQRDGPITFLAKTKQNNRSLLPSFNLVIPAPTGDQEPETGTDTHTKASILLLFVAALSTMGKRKKIK